MIGFNNFSKKVKIAFAVVVAAVACAAALFAYYNFGNFKIPELTVADENGNTIQAIRGGYKWRTGGGVVLADSLSPLDFDYMAENTLTVEKESLLTINSKNTVFFGYRDFTVTSLYRYNNQGKHVEIRDSEYQNAAFLQRAPKEKGEYIYSLRLEYRRGSVDYCFKVIVTDSSGLTDDSTDISTTINRTDAEFFYPMTNHLHTFSFDDKVFTPADDFMLEHAIISDLDASVYFKLDDLCTYARELTDLSDEQIKQIEAYENIKNIYGSRYIRLIDLHDVGIYTMVGWVYSSHTPVNFFTNEPDVTAPVTTQ